MRIKAGRLVGEKYLSLSVNLVLILWQGLYIYNRCVIYLLAPHSTEGKWDLLILCSITLQRTIPKRLDVLLWFAGKNTEV